jgi:transcriptional regulator with XRE-family HTH domain
VTTEEARALGAAIRHRREQRGMKFNVLADLSGVGPITLTAIENGAIPPSSAQLANIATALVSDADALRRSAHNPAVTA